MFGSSVEKEESSSEVVGSSEESQQTAAFIRGVVDSSAEGQTAAPLNKSDDCGYLETVKYVE